MLFASSISISEFKTVLERYQNHIDALSKSKIGDAGTAETLKELDVHRVSTIPDRLARLKANGEVIFLEKEEVGQLIKWKL